MTYNDDISCEWCIIISVHCCFSNAKFPNYLALACPIMFVYSNNKMLMMCYHFGTNHFRHWLPMRAAKHQLRLASPRQLQETKTNRPEKKAEGKTASSETSSKSKLRSLWWFDLPAERNTTVCLLLGRTWDRSAYGHCSSETRSCCKGVQLPQPLVRWAGRPCLLIGRSLSRQLCRRDLGISIVERNKSKLTQLIHQPSNYKPIYTLPASVKKNITQIWPIFDKRLSSFMSYTRAVYPRLRQHLCMRPDAPNASSEKANRLPVQVLTYSVIAGMLCSATNHDASDRPENMSSFSEILSGSLSCFSAVHHKTFLLQANKTKHKQTKQT